MKSFYQSGLYESYFPLLYRYARIVTGNEDAAATAALKALWDCYYSNDDVSWNSPHIRPYLKTTIANNCISANQLSIFNRSMIKLPLKPRHHNILNQPSKTSFL